MCPENRQNLTISYDIHIYPSCIYVKRCERGACYVWSDYWILFFFWIPNIIRLVLSAGGLSGQFRSIEAYMSSTPLFCPKCHHPTFTLSYVLSYMDMKLVRIFFFFKPSLSSHHALLAEYTEALVYVYRFDWKVFVFHFRSVYQV